MLSETIIRKILDTLSGAVLSTSMIAKRTKLSRITVSKYLSAMESKGLVEVTRIGKALAWKAIATKPLIGIIAKTGTARIVQLALGDDYRYTLATGLAGITGAVVVITDSPRVARSLTGDVILIGHTDDNAFCIPELFEVRELAALVHKLIDEQHTPEVAANAYIAIEHIEECEDVFGFQGAEELIAITGRLLREHGIAYTRYERTLYLIEGTLPEGVLADIEQAFHTILAHLYGEMVMPGDVITYEDITHTVPSLTITLSAPIPVNDVHSN